jgi:hypothetical protein
MAIKSLLRAAAIFTAWAAQPVAALNRLENGVNLDSDIKAIGLRTHTLTQVRRSDSMRIRLEAFTNHQHHSPT